MTLGCFLQEYKMMMELFFIDYFCVFLHTQITIWLNMEKLNSGRFFSHGLKSSYNWIWPQNTFSSFIELYCGGFLRNCLENFCFLLHLWDNLSILTI